MRDVPAPQMRAPILLRQSATSVISGSCAAFSITVVPLASAAAMIAVWVPPTVTFGKTISPPFQSLRRAGHDIAAVDVDFGAELFDRHDQEIDRPRADGAAAGHRHPRFPHAGDERRQHPEARPHFRDQFIGRGGVDDIGRGNMQRLPGIRRFARPLAADRNVDAVIAEDTLQRGDSASRGTLSRMSVSSVRRPAIIKGSVAFFAPEIGMEP